MNNALIIKNRMTKVGYSPNCPTYLLPKLPIAVLLGIGLLVLMGYLGFGRYHVSSANPIMQERLSIYSLYGIIVNKILGYTIF